MELLVGSYADKGTMAHTPSMSFQCPDFLLKHVRAPQAGPSRPHITVTWAQSLDFKIAGPGGQRVVLSGPESMLMTHWSVAHSRHAPMEVLTAVGCDRCTTRYWWASTRSFWTTPGSAVRLPKLPRLSASL